MNGDNKNEISHGLYGGETELYEHFFQVAQPKVQTESSQPVAGNKGQEVKGSKNDKNTLG